MCPLQPSIGATCRIVRRALLVLICTWPLLALHMTPHAASDGRISASDAPKTNAGPKLYYVALGDSIAYGKQPIPDYTKGYADQFFSYLQPRGTRYLIDMACPGQKSGDFIGGSCKYAPFLKYRYSGSQLQAALAFIRAHPGQVSPVTLDLGINDMSYAQNFKECSLLAPQAFAQRVAIYGSNMATIFAQLTAALHGTGDLLVMTNYASQANQCPTNTSVVQAFNHVLSDAARRYGVRVARAFDVMGGASVPNAALCLYTWVCSPYQDFHPTARGYALIAAAFESAAAYGPVPPLHNGTGIPAGPSKPVGPTMGTHVGTINQTIGTASYTFKAGASGPATVGACPDSAMLSNGLAVYDGQRRLLAQSTVSLSVNHGSLCNWVGISVTAGLSYTVVISSRIGGGDFDFTSAWSINHSPVVWHLTSSTHISRRITVDFVILSPGTIHASICGQSHTRFSLSFRTGKDEVLASTAQSARCQSLSYTPPNRDNYRLKVLAVSGSGAWAGTITTY